jgi:hypothetical protein
MAIAVGPESNALCSIPRFIRVKLADPSLVMALLAQVT